MGHSAKKIMPEKTLEALKQSIKKWERIVRSTKAKDEGRDNCALCQLFVTHTGSCHGCPVQKRTKYDYCINSPQPVWCNHLDYHGYRQQTRVLGCKECLRLARAERDFLISLLPR
jgi:recombinational DNA repair protein RecR